MANSMILAAIVATVGPGSERFRGYMDNTEFGKALLGLVEAR